MLKEIKTVLKNVEYLLMTYSETRNNDRDLYYFYNVNFTKAENVYDFIYNMPAFETIRRSRQRIQQEGKYQAVEVVKDLREQEEYDVRKLFAL